MQQTNEIDRARDALYSMPPDCDRGAWVKTGMAAHAAGLGFDDFDQWSAGADSYNAQACRATWRSFKAAPGGVSAGALFGMARDHGWTDNSASDRHARPAKATTRPAEPPKKAVPSANAEMVWNRCTPTTAHAYATSKAASPESMVGLREVPDGDALRIAGESMSGALVVPCRAADGSLSTLQFITAGATAERLKAAGKATKLNLPGASVTGWFEVGQIKPGEPVFLCEGVGAAWSVWQATGAAAVVCFGWGNVSKVAATMRQQDPAAKLVICPDVGKEKQAAEIATEHGCMVAAMPDGWPQNSDVNDLFLRDGFDVLAALLEAATAPPKPEPRYKLLSADDLRALPPLRWCVRGVLPAVGLAALFGPSASGKSFLALDMATAIASGQSWFGCRVEAAPVVYACLEGEAGFKLRAQVWEVHHGQRLPDGLSMMIQPFKLTDARDVHDLAAVIPAGAVVFIDTLNRAAPGADENASKDMGEILEAAKVLQTKTGGLVVLVHHTGKNAAAGLRGHSSLFAAMDAAVEVSRDGDRREWKVAKSKDGADGDAHPFKLQVETLGTDEFGDAITSCVVTAGEPDSPKSRRDHLPRAAKLAFDALVLALVTDGVPAPQSIKDRVGLMAPLKVAPEEAWRAGCYQAGIAESDAEADSKRRAFSRARNQLLDLEVVATFEGFVWAK